MGTFLTFGTVWFWLLAISVVVTIISLLENALNDTTDNGGGGWATATLLGFVGLYYFFGSKDEVIQVFNYIISNPFQIIGVFAGYLVAGVIWAFFKWNFFLDKLKDQEIQNRKIWANTSHKPESLKIPTASNNKYRIMSWMYYWPFSGLWTLINEPVKKSFEYIYSKIGGGFDRMSKNRFADLAKQVEEEQAAYDKMVSERGQAERDRLSKKQLNS